jgi:ring-1,2-phenylacetyl-CoA epoxidase subunit PaaD
MVDHQNITVEQVREILSTVMDPEVPVLSIFDLGIVRNIEVSPGKIEVTITPTYSGCPAMDVIRMNIRLALTTGLNNQFSGLHPQFIVHTILSPAWTTDWMTESGKQKLKAYGIAPPNQKALVCTPDLFSEEEAVQCPLCNSFNTELISKFGSTACKSLYRCKDCQEPFDHFKCH